MWWWTLTKTIRQYRGSFGRDLRSWNWLSWICKRSSIARCERGYFAASANKPRSGSGKPTGCSKLRRTGRMDGPFHNGTTRLRTGGVVGGRQNGTIAMFARIFFPPASPRVVIADVQNLAAALVVLAMGLVRATLRDSRAVCPAATPSALQSHPLKSPD